MIRYYFDAHMRRAIADGLQRRELDVVMAVDIGMADASDQEHLTRAEELSRVVVTKDDDFLRLAQGLHHAGIVFIHSKKSDKIVFDRLQEITQRMSMADMSNHVEWA